MGLFDLVWNVHQQRRLNTTDATVSMQQHDTLRTSREIVELRAMVDRLALTNQALWEFVSEQTGLTEEDLEERIKTIDLRDGVADGRISAPVMSCPECGRTNKTSRTLCLYCGVPLKP